MRRYIKTIIYALCVTNSTAKRAQQEVPVSQKGGFPPSPNPNFRGHQTFRPFRFPTFLRGGPIQFTKSEVFLLLCGRC